MKSGLRLKWASEISSSARRLFQINGNQPFCTLGTIISGAFVCQSSACMSRNAEHLRHRSEQRLLLAEEALPSSPRESSLIAATARRQMKAPGSASHTLADSTEPCLFPAV